MIRYYAILSLMLLQLACDQKSNRVSFKNNQSGNHNPPVFPPPGGGGGVGGNPITDPNAGAPGRCIAAGIPDSTSGTPVDYYRFQIVGRGFLQTPSTPSWKSNALNSSGQYFYPEQYKFQTNQRLRLRVIAKPYAPAGTANQYGSCRDNLAYNRLKFKIGIKRDGHQTTYDRVVEFPSGLFVDPGDNSSCSPIVDVDMSQIPSGVEPLKFEIFEVNWDRCGAPTQAGSAPPNNNAPCAFNHVWNERCFQLELQIVTDDTFNFAP